MRPDVLDLQAYYDTRLGEITRALIRTRLSRLECNAPDPRLLAMGYALPYLDCMGRHPTGADRIAAVMPAGQGALAYPEHGPNQTLLADLHHLPFAEAVFDRALLIHCLEYVGGVRAVLQEVRRVLAPGGRMVAIVPNRSGLWAWADQTPFGNGRPFSSGQLRSLFGDAGFTIARMDMALMLPPWPILRPLMARSETMGQALWSKLGGVYVIEAEKRRFASTCVRKSAPAFVALPGLSPAPAPATYQHPSLRAKLNPAKSAKPSVPA